MTIPRLDQSVALVSGARLVGLRSGLKVKGADGTRLARLNESAGLVVRLAEPGLRVGELVELLAEAYSESAAALEAEVLALLGELLDSGVLRIIEPSRRTTIVTGVFDLGRGDEQGIASEQRRSFDWYLQHLAELMAVDVPMSIYIDPQYEDFVWRHRSPHDTTVWHRSADQVETQFPFFEEVQRIRSDPRWLDQAEWLRQSPQAALPRYVPMVMSKIGMLHDQSIINPFGSDHFVWIDGAITATVPPTSVTDQRFWDHLDSHLDRFLLVSYPYTGAAEIHGFTRTELHDLAGVDHTNWVARGGIFGGHRDRIAEVNTLYNELMETTLEGGLMGTEESLLTILGHRHDQLFDVAEVGADGLVGPFFDEVAARTVEVRIKDPLHGLRTALYVLSFNQPAEFESTLESWSAQPGFISRTENYLLDNSTDPSTTADYERICETWGFADIKKANLGINGGRQFCADHFAGTDCDYMIFLEDDMQLKGPDAGLCRSGMAGYVPDLFRRAHLIMEAEHYDFLKFSFTEVWGNNSEQWSWYNVSQERREELWPEYPTLPAEGHADDMPATELNRMGCIEGLSYVDGEIYYANWPQLVSREGNERMFREQRWERPFEQHWMAYMFELSRMGKLRPAVLLASPVHHNRIHHYEPELRRES